MEAKIMKVVSVGQPFEVSSKKTDSGKMMKNTCVLREFGGNFEDAFLVSLLDKNAFLDIKEGDVVFVKLRFSVREANQSKFMDALATEIEKLS